MINIRQIALIILGVLSAFIALLTSFWLLLFGGNLLALGGKYSITTEQGSMICGISFFTFDNLDAIFYMLIAPVLVLIFSIKFAMHCFRVAATYKLP